MDWYAWQKFHLEVLLKKLVWKWFHKVDDYLLVHVGVAISIVDEVEAKRTFQYLEEMGEVAEELNISEFLPDKEEYR